MVVTLLPGDQDQHQLQLQPQYRPDRPNIKPDEVGGGERVEVGGDLHQVRLLVPDPVEQSGWLVDHKTYLIQSCNHINSDIVT